MARPASAPPGEACSPVYRVEAPRASDAIGFALRDAFDSELGLPEDMAAMLRTLNRHERRSH